MSERVRHRDPELEDTVVEMKDANVVARITLGSPWVGGIPGKVFCSFHGDWGGGEGFMKSGGNPKFLGTVSSRNVGLPPDVCVCVLECSIFNGGRF